MTEHEDGPVTYADPSGVTNVKRWKPVRDERGQAATFSVVIVIVVVVLAALLVWKISDLAVRIDDKAGAIQKTAVPINRATDAVTNIPETNRLASSILTSARPLEGELAQIINLAKDVDRLAASINSTAAGIDDTAAGIDNTASQILPVARAILADVNQINRNLDISLAPPRAPGIKSDTGEILGLANTAHARAACIDSKLSNPLLLRGPAADAKC